MNLTRTWTANLNVPRGTCPWNLWSGLRHTQPGVLQLSDNELTDEVTPFNARGTRDAGQATFWGLRAGGESGGS